MLNDYTYKIHNIKWRDYITRILIIIVLKYGFNENPKFINYETFKIEFEKTVAFMTKKININLIDEIFNGLDLVELEDIKFKNSLKEIKSEEPDSSENIYPSDSDDCNSTDFNNIDNELFNDENNFCFDYDYINNILTENEENNDAQSNIFEEKERLDIKSIIKVRDYLNLFSLEKDLKYNLEDILLKKDGNDNDDLESLENKISKVSIKNKKNKNK